MILKKKKYCIPHDIYSYSYVITVTVYQMCPSINILKLFQEKERKKKYINRLSQKKKSSCKVFCKMKYQFCKATKLDDLQKVEPLAKIFS